MTLSPESQVISVISWLVVLFILQISLYPALKKTFKSFAFPAAFAASLLLFTLFSWYCGLIHLPVQLALLPFISLLIFHPNIFQYYFFKKGNIHIANVDV